MSNTADDVKNENEINNNDDAIRTETQGVKGQSMSRKNTFIQNDSNNDEDNSWGGVLTGNVQSRNLRNSKHSSFINSNYNSNDNETSTISSLQDNDDAMSYYNRYNHSKRESFISYTESIQTNQTSDDDSFIYNQEKKKSFSSGVDSSPSNDSSQSPDNYYDETESSTSSSADLDDLISNDDPMLLNIINMSINNYKKNEQPTTSNGRDSTSNTATPSLSKQNSAVGISSMANHKQNRICFQQNPIIINSIEEESNHVKSISSENQTSSSHQFTESATSSQSTLSQIEEEIISPETLARSTTCKEYLEVRYDYINDLINNDQVYNPLFIMRWRTRMWIIQATQGHINTLKKNRKNQNFWFIDNSDIDDFKTQYHKPSVILENSTEENKTSVDQSISSSSNTTYGHIHNNSSSNNNSEDNSVWKTDEFKDNISERGNIKTSPTDTDLSGYNKDKFDNQIPSSLRDKRASLPPVFDHREALNEEILSSYKNIFKNLKSEVNDNNESDGSVFNKNLGNDSDSTAVKPSSIRLTHTSSISTNGTSPLALNTNTKEDTDSLINLFIPKVNNRNKKPLLSIITNNLNNAYGNNNAGSGSGTQEFVPNSAPLLEINTSSSSNRQASKLSTLTEYHSDIGDELTIQTPQSSKFPSSNPRLLTPRSRFSEIPSVKKIDEHIIDSNESKDDNNFYLDVPIQVRRRRSSMPDISRFQNQSFINIKKNRDKSLLSNAIENSIAAINYTGSNYNLDTPTSTKNPLRKILLRKRGKQTEQQDSGDEIPNGSIKYNNMDVTVTSSNIYLNNKSSNNNNPSESKNIKKIFNMDSKGIRSIIKDIQPKFQYDKKQSLTKSDLENSTSSINNDDTESSTVKPTNLECTSPTTKKNSDDKKKKRNLLNIKKIFERNNTTISIRNKRNSEILSQSENESDENNGKRANDYVNSWIRSNGHIFNETEDDTYSNSDEDFYNDRYNEIMEECTAPNLKFDFTNEEFLKKNPLLFNTKIVLTCKPSNKFRNKSAGDVELDDLIELEEKYRNLIEIIYKNLEENVLESIRYNLIKANYCIYNFTKELQNMNNMDIFKTQEIKNIIDDLDLTNSRNEELYQKGDIMEKETDKSKKDGSLSVDFVNENTTVIYPEIKHRKSVINRIYNVKDRSFLFNEMDNTDNDGDNESVSSSVYGSPVIYEEPENLFSSDVVLPPKTRNNRNLSRRGSKRASIKMESILEYDRKEPIDNKPILDGSNSPTNVNNNIYRGKNSFSSEHKFKNFSFSRENSFTKTIMEKPKKQYSKREVNEDIENIDKQYDDIENVTNTINKCYENNSNKIETIINESIEVSNTLNDDLFIRMKAFEENKQNKTYFKKNVVSEIGFITLDYFLTLIGGLYWLFYKFLKILKTVLSGAKFDSDNDKEINENDKSDSNKDQFYHGISSSSMNKENSLSKGKVNSNSDVGSKRMYNTESNNLSTNITENFRENMKRITELINNSYNKSVEEENQIMNIQKKLHELRSSNKPVNKDDIYSLIRGSESEQKIGSADSVKKLQDKSSSIEVANESEKCSEEIDNKIPEKSEKSSDGHLEKTTKTEIDNEVIEGNEPLKVEVVETISDHGIDLIQNNNNDQINDNNNEDNGSNVTINSNNEDNGNTEVKNNNNNEDIDKIKSSDHNHNSNDRITNNHNDVVDNNNVNNNMNIKSEFTRTTSLHENCMDMYVISENENDDANSIFSNPQSSKKKFKFKNILKKQRSHTDKNDMNSSKSSTFIIPNQLSNSPSFISNPDSEAKEMKDSPVKRRTSLARRASKLLNINTLKNLKNKEKDNKIDEYTGPVSIPNDVSFDNRDIDYYISLSPYELPSMSNNNKKELSDSNSVSSNGSKKMILSNNNSVLSSAGLNNEES